MVLGASWLNRLLLWPRSGLETRFLQFNLFTKRNIGPLQRACQGNGSDIFPSPAGWAFPRRARSFSRESCLK